VVSTVSSGGADREEPMSADGESVPTPDPEVSDGPPVRRSWARAARRRAGIVLAALAIAGLGAAGGLRELTGSAEAMAPEPRDVPRDEGGAIIISDAYRRRVGIKFAAVGTRIAGFVKRVLKLEGDEVHIGDALAEIESAELGQAQARVASALAEQYAAKINARREASLLVDQLTTARESEEAAATLASREAALAAAKQSVMAMGGDVNGPLGLRVLRAPIAGHVVEALIGIGQSVEPHKLAFRIANLDSVWIELEVFERTVGLVRAGDTVIVTPMADPSRRIKGKVAHVGELIDSSSRSAEVRVQVENRDRLLRPGQAVTALIPLSAPARNVVTIPSEAVTYVDNTPTVFVAVSPNRMVPTKVHLGFSDDERQEVLSGLGGGERVVATGVFALKSELFR
jgi:cobalt-zinc-cadmium efflux system membrane fusion protein